LIFSDTILKWGGKYRFKGKKMLALDNITKRFSQGKAILDAASCKINNGERVGLVGPNGAGKSTLLAIITKSLEPDAGAVHLSKSGKIGYLRQETDFLCTAQTTILDYCLDSFTELNALEERIHQLEEQLQTNCSNHQLLDELGQLQHQFEASGGYSIRHNLEKCLSGLGFQTADFQRYFKEFSGGWQMRAELARILVSNPDLLLLDEPTNYLDVEAVEWLHGFLKKFSGTLILISHDRYLLNTLTEHTVVLMHGKLRKFKGNYDAYLEKYEQEVKVLAAAQKNQEKKKEQLERFVERFKAKATKASQARSRQKQLDKMESVEIQDFRMTPSKITLPDPPRCGHELVRLNDVSFSYDNERFIYQNLTVSINNGEKLAFSGWNGVGKTTLLRLLCGSLCPTKGVRATGSNVSIGYHSQEYVETMNPDLTVWEVVRQNAGEASDGQVRSILGSFRFIGDDIYKPVEVLSGGEKVRLSFCRMLVNPPNLLILDEPTAHLDIGTRASLEQAIKAFSGTVCLVSHDIDFIKAVAENIIEVTPNKLTRYYGDYDYFRQKKAEHEAASQAVATPSTTKTVYASIPEPALSRKEQRRLEAEKRNSINKVLKPLKKEVEKIELTLETLEEEKSSIWEKLTSETNPEAIKKLNQRLSVIEKEQDSLNESWEQKAEALEELEASLN
jgi:ATP-binding cassette subfamily F protein 3